MIKMYSRRLLSPFVGVIQVAEMGRARALSLDGENWSIQYALPDDTGRRGRRYVGDPSSDYSRVATVRQGRLETHDVHPFLDPHEVRAAAQHLFEALGAARVPFVAADCYEYWLLDASDDTPLALLQSSVDAQAMALPSPYPVWLAMPAAELDVPAPEPTQDVYVPPVNYRLEKSVEERAGAKPRAAWFERTDPPTDDFPPCLIREDWPTEKEQLLCDLYIQRLAPRLLMTHGLPRPVRHRLEQAARDHVFDVERFYAVYPDVVDDDLLTAARVEARMRRANE
ncbi:hypothetical protein B1C78_07860 [Thioalkalivibrio denitrificans]|uniref:Uncharacterized protein n=1 Tax=Thioalkalivibrio denitrificans TaxID=108003 RepID=A0A1V3NIC3_9GAMM|nr:hypothetical protein [Thioalkalivibrio denitrificans]OOG24734.1 hypothetical protein B1C78_07860 [Thioalkalivibrio denitrificans]